MRHRADTASINSFKTPPITPARGPSAWDDAPEPMSDWDLL